MVTQIASGTLIDSRYEIRKVLGQGGFGRTYLAADSQRFGHLCVLKEFVPASGTDYVIQKSRELFEREARVLYQIEHPQIPKFLALLNDKERLFLVQEYIDGKSYSQLLSERQQQGQSFSEAEVIQWLRDLLPVLEYIHSLNIIHRDISLENVMLPQGQSKPVLIDFGLVKEAVTQVWSMHGENSQPDPQGSVVGKFGYAPPEQIRMGQCYRCSDIYALGVTAVVLLTGRKPRLLIDQGTLEWSWHPYVNISGRLARILDKMLAEKPRDRYQSAKEVLAELEFFTLPREVSTEQHSLKQVQINIDVAKKERQVAEILETDTFKMLEQRAHRLRRKLQSEPDSESHPQASQPSPPRKPVSKPLFQIPQRSIPAEPKVAIPQRPQETEPTAPLNPAFIERCKQELSQCIGPVANFILEDVLAQYPRVEPKRLVEAIIKEIPDPQRAEEFKNRIEIALASQSAISPGGMGSQLQLETEKSAALNPAFIERCKQEFVRCVGPMASFILEDTLAQYPRIDPQQLIEFLAAEIPNTQRAKEFRNRIETAPEFQSAMSSGGRASQQQPEAEKPAALNPAFLERCKQEFVRCVGPMASLILEDTLNQYPHFLPQQLVEALAAEIPNPQKAKEFKQRLL